MQKFGQLKYIQNNLKNIKSAGGRVVIIPTNLKNLERYYDDLRLLDEFEIKVFTDPKEESALIAKYANEFPKNMNNNENQSILSINGEDTRVINHLHYYEHENLKAATNKPYTSINN